MVADLITLAFCFLLRVGEYTSSTEERQTTPLRKRDIRLWRQGSVLDPEAPMDTLYTADAVTICLENQKNGDRNSTLHHYTSKRAVDPVRAAARLLDALRGRPGNTPIGSYTNSRGRQARISARHIREAIREAAVECDLPAQGYDLKRIGSHSLRSGGAMALKLAGYSHDIIQKLGRWRSDTYLRYIQTQIAQLTSGVAANMTRLTQFQNVG